MVIIWPEHVQVCSETGKPFSRAVGLFQSPTSRVSGFSAFLSAFGVVTVITTTITIICTVIILFQPFGEACSDVSLWF